MNFVDVLRSAHWLVAFGAGFLAGGINVIVGAGTLVSFPLLVLLGYPPITANISNTIGILPGSFSGVVVYREELISRRKVVRTLLPASVAGGVCGAALLLAFPGEVFATVVPWLIGVGTLLVVLGPEIKRRVQERHSGDASHTLPAGGTGKTGEGVSGLSVAFTSKPATVVAVVGAFLLGTYGGYFGAAQGVLLIGLLGILSWLSMQELNGIKNLTVLAVNLIAAIVFIIVSHSNIDWALVAIIAAGAACGGIVGGRFAKRLSAGMLRAFVVVVGVSTVVFMLVAK